MAISIDEDISQTRNEINELESRIRKLNGEIAKVQNQIADVQYDIDTLGDACSNSDSKMFATQTRTITSFNNDSNVLKDSNNLIGNVITTQMQIREMYFIFKDVETANKRIRELTDKLYFEFKNQRQVRKIVRALLDNLDLNIISEERLYKSIERSHLQTPDFYLTYILLAIMYWKNNNREKCNQCIEEALKLNEESTVLFMLLFNIKIERYDTALSWFKCYEGLNHLGKENYTHLMLISSIPCKLNDQDNSKYNELSIEILKYIKEKIEEGEKNVDSYVNVIKNFYEKMDEEETLEYKNFRKYVKDYQSMANALSKAKNNTDILEYLTKLSQVLKREKNLILDNYIENLINTLSDDEQVIQDEIDYNDEIINSITIIKNGESLINSTDYKKLAKEKVQARINHDKSALNLSQEVFNWAFVKPDKDENTLTKWNLFVLNGDYAKKAYQEYKNMYHAMLNPVHQVAIYDFSFETDFKDKERDLKTMNKFVDNKKTFLLKSCKMTNFILCIIFAVLCLVGMIVSFATKNTGLGIIAAIATVFLVVLGVLSFLNTKKKRKNTDEDCENLRIKLNQNIEDLYHEKGLYDALYVEADKVSIDIEEFLNKVKY